MLSASELRHIHQLSPCESACVSSWNYHRGSFEYFVMWFYVSVNDSGPSKDTGRRLAGSREGATGCPLEATSMHLF